MIFVLALAASLETYSIEAVLAVLRSAAGGRSSSCPPKLRSAARRSIASFASLQDRGQRSIPQRSDRALLPGARRSGSGWRSLVLDRNAWRVRQARWLTFRCNRCLCDDRSRATHRPEIRESLRHSGAGDEPGRRRRGGLDSCTCRVASWRDRHTGLGCEQVVPR